MALTPKLEIKQSQSLLLTPELRQAINLLQMNNLELNQLVEQELVSNPLLEREDDYLAAQDDIPVSGIDEPTSSIDDTEELSADLPLNNEFDDYGSDTVGLENWENADWSDYNHSKEKRNDDDSFDYFQEKLAQTKSFHDIIDEQIMLAFDSAADRLIAKFLSEQLDAAGYFRGDITTLASTLKTSPQRLADILAKLKQFEPSGIFAENLAECLRIQLSDLNQLSPEMEHLLDNLPLLAAKKFKELSLLCHCSVDELPSLINCLKSLNPKPAAAYTQELTSYIIPDVFVTRSNLGEYRVELNSMTLPRLLINHHYYSQLNTDKKASRYLKENLNRASFLIKAMHQRATSILRVCEEIVLRQYHFLEQGIEYLKPMCLKDIALALNINESTVSRVTNGKYMSTPRGIFELKYFFSSAAGSYIGNDDTSTTTLKHKIKTLIENEDVKHILSDDNIVSLLGQEGIKIARRTVTKYRESMGIPTSSQRKRTKRV